VLRESVRKELFQNLLTTRFLTCVILSLILIVFGAIVGCQEYRERLEEYGEQQSSGQERLSEVRVYSHIKPVLSKEPSPLLILNKGHSDRVGNTITISHKRVPFLAQGGGLDNEILALFPTFDLMDVIRYVLGLLAILLSFDAISGERESGTLRLVLSNSIPRATVAISKYLGGAISIFISLLLGFLVSLLFINVYSPVGLTGEDWLRIVSVLITAGFYLSAMLLIGLSLSAMTQRSSTALMLAMLAWLMLVVVVPNLSSFMASEAVEVESSRSLRLKVESLEREAEIAITDYEKRLRPSAVMGDLSIYGTDEEVLVRLGRPERYAWLTDYYTYRNTTWLRYADFIWDVRRGYLHNLSRQAALSHSVSRISPAVMVEIATQKLIGASRADHEDFMEAAREYRGEIIAYLEDRNGFNSRRWFTDDPPDQEPLVLDPSTFDRNKMDMTRAWSMLTTAREDRSRVLNLSDMPRFHFYPAVLSDSIKRSTPELFALIGLNIFLFGLYFWAFSRYDIR
jgi:ABC-type transport system involved in multi-copper enzyme maturation permease subunit